MQNANVAQAIVDFGNTDKFLKLEGGLLGGTAEAADTRSTN